MSKTSLVRSTSTAIVVGAGVMLAPFALAAPASANVTCAPGGAAYPPGSCTAPGAVQAPSRGALSAQFSAVPNGNAVAQNALSGTSVSGYSINTGQPGDSSGPNAALIAGGAALVLVALGGGVVVARRRSEG